MTSSDKSPASVREALRSLCNAATESIGLLDHRALRAADHRLIDARNSAQVLLLSLPSDAPLSEAPSDEDVEAFLTWQHDETGRICEREHSPGPHWSRVDEPAASTPSPAAPTAPAAVACEDGITIEACIAWLDAKFMRHKEPEDKAAANYLRRSALSTAAVKAAEAPGWQLVPIEPTIGMCIAGDKARLNVDDSTRTPAIYRAMIAAASAQGKAVG